MASEPGAEGQASGKRRHPPPSPALSLFSSEESFTTEARENQKGFHHGDTEAQRTKVFLLRATRAEILLRVLRAFVVNLSGSLCLCGGAFFFPFTPPPCPPCRNSCGGGDIPIPSATLRRSKHTETDSKVAKCPRRRYGSLEKGLGVERKTL